MRKLQLVIAFIAGLAFVSCSSNEKKEQVNDETKEIEAQSHSMEEGLEEQGVEEDKDLDVNVDADKKEVGVETEDVNVDLKGEDNEEDTDGGNQ